MKHLKTYENTTIDINEYYEIRGIDSNGEEFLPIDEDDDANYNPFDLKEMVKLLMKKNKIKGSIPSLYLVKVKSERVPFSTVTKLVEEIKLENETNKFNL